MNSTLRKWLLGTAAAVLVVWTWKHASESEMRRLDKEVDRLCAIDGRSVIYETVKLPADRFDKHGRSLVPPGKDDIEFGYYYAMSSETLAGPGQEPGARLLRTEYRVVRTSDNQVLALHVYYTRGGGYWLEGVPGVGSGGKRGQVLPFAHSAPRRLPSSSSASTSAITRLTRDTDSPTTQGSTTQGSGLAF